MEKIEALKKTIYNLENNVYVYDWSSCESCNCGVIAKTILNGRGLGTAGLYSSKDTNGYTFHRRFRYYVATCSTTGMPVPEVISALLTAGFEFEELEELEYLRNEKILKRIGINFQSCYSSKDNVILYLKAWVLILEESSQKLSKEPDVQGCDATKPIVVPSAWPNKQSSLTNLIPIVDEVVDVKNVKIEL